MPEGPRAGRLQRRQLALALLASPGLMGAAPERVWKVFGDATHRPLMFLHDGHPAGVLVERVQACAGALGEDRLAVELTGWAQAMKHARDGLGGLLGASYTQERATWLDYSAPLYVDEIRVVTRSAHGLVVRGLSSLRGLRLGIGYATSFGEPLDRAIAEGWFPKVERDGSLVRRLRMLLADRIDVAVFGAGLVGFECALAQDPQLAARRAEFHLPPEPVHRDPMHLAFPKSLQAEALLRRFNAALDRLGPAKGPRAPTGCAPQGHAA